MSSEFAELVYRKLREVPIGRVVTYSDLAKLASKPGAARAVGTIMNKNPYAPEVPCHRVVNSDGRVGGFASGTKKKIKMLRKEGVIIENDRVINFINIRY